MLNARTLFISLYVRFICIPQEQDPLEAVQAELRSGELNMSTSARQAMEHFKNALVIVSQPQFYSQASAQDVLQVRGSYEVEINLPY